MSFKTYYDRLGLPLNASQDDIKVAYRKLAQELHPDKLPTNISGKMSELAKQEFNELREAYLVLSNPNARTTYDRRLAERRLAEERAAEQKARNHATANSLRPSKPWNLPLMTAALGAAGAIIIVSIVNAVAAIDRQSTVRATGASSAPSSPATNVNGVDTAAAPTVPVASATATAASATAASEDIGTGGEHSSETAPDPSPQQTEFTPGEITRFATALLELQPILSSTKAKLESASTSIERQAIENDFDVQATRILLSHGMQPEEYQQIAARTETDAKIRLDVIAATVRIQRLGRHHSP